jgi:hypothetical protein
MRKLTWYRQKRIDGGIRTGVDVDGTTLFHQFENESTEPDPALLWYVDLRCEGARLPHSASNLRQWLLDQSDIITQAFSSLAHELRAGVDVDYWPLRRKIDGLPAKLKGAIVCSVARRLEGLELARVLSDVSENWGERIRVIPEARSSRAG